MGAIPRGSSTCARLSRRVAFFKKSVRKNSAHEASFIVIDSSRQTAEARRLLVRANGERVSLPARFYSAERKMDGRGSGLMNPSSGERGGAPPPRDPDGPVSFLRAIDRPLAFGIESEEFVCASSADGERKARRGNARVRIQMNTSAPTT